LRAAVRAPGAQLSTPLTANVQNGCVVVLLPANLPVDIIRNLDPRLSPLGGKVTSDHGSVQLWLPRA